MSKATPTSVLRPVLQFAATGLAAVVLLGGAGALVLRHLAREEAIRDARSVTRVAGEGIVEPLLGPGILTGNKKSLARLDTVVRRRVLRPPVVRVKLWTAAGRVVYSDEPRLIGAKFFLADEERRALTRGQVQAEVSDHSQPENRYERGQGKLLEVYLPLRTSDGGRLLFEQYLRYSSVAATGRKVWKDFLPALLGTLVLLELLQVPLAWSLARKLRDRQRERESLLTQAVEASDVERRRIAADLHDGPVQELAGLAFGLSADADRIAAHGPSEAADALRRAASSTRQAMRRLRALLVQIYPPSLHRAGLGAALSDLLAPVRARGIETSLVVPDELSLPPEAEQLLFRVAQEGLRNVLAHSSAQAVAVAVEHTDHRVALTVTDDGSGFPSEEAERRRRSGHLGLALLGDLAAGAGGSLTVDSQLGHGTRLRMEVPTA